MHFSKIGSAMHRTRACGAPQVPGSTDRWQNNDWQNDVARADHSAPIILPSLGRCSGEGHRPRNYLRQLTDTEANHIVGQTTRQQSIKSLQRRISLPLQQSFQWRNDPDHRDRAVDVPFVNARSRSSAVECRDQSPRRDAKTARRICAILGIGSIRLI